jgi:hypothetical protein|tara:strand:- start:935 stop:1147 length:213 start_codon:yes stop_codon:yes gene_type:complete
LTQKNALIFYSAIGFFLIGLYEAFFLGIENSYGVFMFSIALLFLYHFRKNMPQKPPKKIKKKRLKKSKKK